MVIIATCGRAEETRRLLVSLAGQTSLIDRLVVVGATQADIEGVDGLAASSPFHVDMLLTSRAGLPIQRNAALSHLDRVDEFRHADDGAIVVFFDDDFRPACDWIEAAVATFHTDPTIVGLTGRVLADGVKGEGLSEDDARDYLCARRSPQSHWANGTDVRDVGSAYGCNMAFRASIVGALRFDERLPLYGWQEDRDFSGQAMRHGRVVFTPDCAGVHLGAKTGRTKGTRLGYSQIANPLYLMRKGTMGRLVGLRFLARAIAANLVNSVRPHPLIDYRGRLSGNCVAIADLVRLRCAPERILDL